MSKSLTIGEKADYYQNLMVTKDNNIAATFSRNVKETHPIYFLSIQVVFQVEILWKKLLRNFLLLQKGFMAYGVIHHYIRNENLCTYHPKDSRN